MKLLFVSSSPLEYSASSNMRNIALLSGFIKNGYDIYTLTPKPQEDSKLYDETICDIEIKKKYYIEMGSLREKVTMKKGKKNRLKTIIYRVTSKFKMYDFRSSLANKKIIIKEKFDFIISSSDPKSSHLIAESLIENNPNITKKWIQYWGDPFANDINKKNYLPSFMIQKEEKRLISICDTVIYVSPFTLEKQKQLYPEYQNKMKFYPIPYRKEIIYPKTENKKCQVGYYGDYRKKDRNILPLYEAITEDKEKFDLKICGATDLELKEQENIEIEPRQNLNQIREYEAKTDILVCICNNSGTQIPGKVYHYAATNKPILIILDGENKEKMRKYFEHFNRYVICGNNKEEIKKAIQKIVRNNEKCEPLKVLKAEEIANEILK
ncbi:MAG: glycosyltransferase family 4 protein [Bacilli bacterium]|nr:glycosyltransferase family 4 protein [Bacilli bacterium]